MSTKITLLFENKVVIHKFMPIRVASSHKSFLQNQNITNFVYYVK